MLLAGLTPVNEQSRHQPPLTAPTPENAQPVNVVFVPAPPRVSGE